MLNKKKFIVDVCGTPEFRLNQTVTPVFPYYLVGSSVTYNCGNGTSLVGSASRKCQLNGLWSGETPTCVTSKID